jgi:hypothetical protein
VKRNIYFIVLLLGCLSLQALFATAGHCQAWVSPKGSGAISISYINNLDNRDYFGHGENFIFFPPNPLAPNGLKLNNFGELRTQGVYFDFAYSFTDKLGLTVSIPFLAPKYTVPPGVTNAFFAQHHLADGSIPLDDGHYHGSFQDFAFRVRYNVAAHPFRITPFVQYNQPSHDYPIYSHAIVGRDVKSIAFGSYIGSTLGGFLSNAYAQGNYALAFDEKVLNASRRRSLLEGEFGYFITPEFRTFTIFSAQITHGGLNAPEDFPNAYLQALDPLFFHHTQITRDNYLDAGIGAQYSLNSRLDLFGLASHMITARNLHGLAYGITFGMSWGFGGSPLRPCHC